MQLWQGLTNPEFTNRYWSIELLTDWTAGAPMTWNHHGVTIVDPEQVVIEADPYRRLSYTWHAFTPELASRFGIADDVLATLVAERRSKVPSRSRTSAASSSSPSCTATSTTTAPS